MPSALRALSALVGRLPPCSSHRNDIVGLILKQKLCAQLHEPRRAGADDLAEGGTTDVTVDGLWPKELRVIENIEALESEL